MCVSVCVSIFQNGACCLVLESDLCYRSELRPHVVCLYTSNFDSLYYRCVRMELFALCRSQASAIGVSADLDTLVRIAVGT